MKKLLVLSLILMTLLSGCTPKAAEKEELTVLVSADYPPYESIDTNGKFVGFDIEFGELVAEEMGVTFKWVDTAFSGIIGALQAGTGDLAISDMSVTPEREESVDFSQIYKEEGGAFTVLFLADKGYDSIDDLTGLIASTQLGTIQEIALNNLKTDFNFTLDIRDKHDVIVQEILVGRIDFMLVDTSVAEEFVTAFPELAMFDLEHEKLANISGLGVALPEGSEWLDEVNAAIDALRANGKLDALIAKWFSN